VTSGRRGVGLMPMETRRDVIVRTAVLADELGYEIFAVPEGWELDSAPVLTEIALRTARIVCGGRYLLGLGASTQALAEGFHGTAFEHPAAKLRDAVTKVRALLAGPRLPGARRGGCRACPRTRGPGRRPALVLRTGR